MNKLNYEGIETRTAGPQSRSVMVIISEFR